MTGIGSNNINSFQMDVLREIGNIGAGNAATALAKIDKNRYVCANNQSHEVLK